MFPRYYIHSEYQVEIIFTYMYQINKLNATLFRAGGNWTPVFKPGDLPKELYTWPTHYYQYWVKISSRFSCNSEADASELPENLEEMFTRYYNNNSQIQIYMFKYTCSNIYDNVFPVSKWLIIISTDWSIQSI